MTTITTIIANRLPITNDEKTSKEVQFVVCSSCFWNASFLALEVGRICPSSKGSTVNSIPLVRTQVFVHRFARQDVKKHRIQTDFFVGSLTIVSGYLGVCLSKLPPNFINEFFDDPVSKMTMDL